MSQTTCPYCGTTLDVADDETPADAKQRHIEQECDTTIELA